MSRARSVIAVVGRAHDVCYRIVRRLILLSVAAAGAGVVAMMAITCLDVILRVFRRPMVGSVDLVCIAMVFAISGSLPYTTAVKGHVAIEYFFHKLSRRWRTVVDSLARTMSMVLFGLLCWRSVTYGLALKQVAQVTPTLQIPVFWLPWIVAASCGLVVLVILYNLLHPGREMIKP